MYLHGKGVKADYNKAFKYLQASADQGWSEGQLNLGKMYFHGQGVKRYVTVVIGDGVTDDITIS